MNNVFEYLNYREFLKDRITHMRQENPNFSFRYFNRKAGFKSSGQLKLVADGNRNLGKKGIYNVCRGLGMTGKEAEFFESLVFFNQAKTHDEKDHYYKELSKIINIPPRADVVDDKEYSARVLSVSKENYERLEQKMIEFRKEIHAMVGDAGDADDTGVTACVNMQLLKLPNDES